MNPSLLNELNQISELTVFPCANLTAYTTMKLEAKGHLIVVKSVLALQKLLPFLTQKDIPYLPLGLGANQILPKDGHHVYIKLELAAVGEDEDIFDLNHLSESYQFLASTPLKKLTAFAIKWQLKGWECFTGIPGTLGGAVCMNAGTSLGEIGDIVEEVSVVTREGQTFTKKMEKNFFSYRKSHFLNPGDIIVGVKLTHRGQDEKIPQIIKDYLQKRSDTQPLNQNTCGCVFKNYSSTCRAGLYIDILNLKGLRFKNLKVSKKHANFVEHGGGNESSDLKFLIKVIQDELYLQFGKKFELEVKI